MSPLSARRFRSRLVRFALIFGGVLLFPSLGASLASTNHAANAPGYPADFADAQWQAAYARKGISVSRADIPGSPIVAFQAETVLDAPIEKVVAVIQDNPRRPEWTPNLAEARVLEKFSDTEWIEYWHLDTPIVISDREAVVRIRTEFDRTRRRLLVHSHSIEGHPAAPKTGRVRLNVVRGNYWLWPTDDGRHTHFVYQAQTALGGSVPAGLTRSFEKDYPYDLLAGLRKQLAREDREITPHPTVRKVFEEAAAEPAARH
jgi:hypothetical protein